MAAIARIHLDAVGGIAGDRFAAAMADAFPEHVAGLRAELAKLGTACAFDAHRDGFLRGQRFLVDESHAHGHAHVRHTDIQARLRQARLAPEVLKHALALFELLARAEGEVHGVAPDDVEFHEVGADDSIADFIAAAYFIAALPSARWSVGALPLGGGRVQTSHGWLPVPAPATAILMKGMEVFDDGITGERVTPTGAAIAAYLVRNGVGSGSDSRRACTLAATGHGFGTRKLPGVPNMLRCMAFVEATMPGPLDEEIATLEFEIDDQSAEDLAVALDRIRNAEGVLDVAQFAAFGKKGRLATHVQVLARVESTDAIADLCLAQTTTLGVRIARVMRRVALRSHIESHGVRVKVAQRPGGELTAKAESDDIARLASDRERREALRARAEQAALDATRTDGRPKRD